MVIIKFHEDKIFFMPLYTINYLVKVPFIKNGFKKYYDAIFHLNMQISDNITDRGSLTGHPSACLKKVEFS